MSEQILPWVGLGGLFFLCLPIPLVQKLVLEVSVWALRLGMIGLLAAGAYLWFRPGELPARVSSVLSDFPRLLALLPEQGSPAFALCLACWVVAALVPVLAMLDVSRKWARRHFVAPVATVAPVAAVVTKPSVATAEEPAPVGVPVMRPVERRTAANAISSAAPRSAR